MNTSPTILSASTLTGDDVVNPQGENLGDIKDFMLDTTSGKIAYVVVAFGGILGMGDKYFAVPWSAFSVDGAKKNVVLNIPQERLKNAPGFNKDHWPNFADAAFGESIRSYYA